MTQHKHFQVDISFRHKVAYALPELAFATVAGPVAAILPALYAKHAMLSVATIGTIFLVMRIFDGITDPLIGYLSDRTRTCIGARKPWVIAGGLLVMVSIFFLFRIPPDAGAGYFTLWAVIYYLGNTMYGIPHMAWGSEISDDYNQRARVFSYRNIANNSGSLLYTLCPLTLFYFGIVQSTEFTPQVFRWLGYLMLILCPIMIAVNVLVAPTGHVVTQERTTLKGVYAEVAKNRPLTRFLFAYILAGIGNGFFGALFYVFIDNYLEIGDAVSYLLIAVLVFSIVSMPLWVKIISLIGKHRAWACGWVINSLTMLPLIFVEPGEAALLPALICFALYGLSNGVSAIAPFALLGDIVDYGILKTGVDRAGNFFAFLYLITKLAGAFGGISLVILGIVFGYQLEVGAVNSDFANFGLVMLFCVLTGVFQILAVPVLWNFPIDKRRHDIIRKRIDQREVRAKEKLSVSP